jgi:hypothetical protein
MKTINPTSFIAAIATALLLSIAHSVAQSSEDLFVRFEKGDFFALTTTNGVIAVSGWKMTSEDGKTYHRAELKRQVDELVKLGMEAVPSALKRLEHPHMHIRYIAAEALSQITKQNPTWYSFGTPGEPFNGNKNWSSDAIAEWKAWYEATQKQEAEQGVSGNAVPTAK